MKKFFFAERAVVHAIHDFGPRPRGIQPDSQWLLRISQAGQA
jgi:hypothetical protein